MKAPIQDRARTRRQGCDRRVPQDLLIARVPSPIPAPRQRQKRRTRPFLRARCNSRAATCSLVFLAAGRRSSAGTSSSRRAQPAWITSDPEMRFKYGSIGAENDAGIPYWIFYVLPRVFPTSCRPGRLRQLRRGMGGRPGAASGLHQEGHRLPRVGNTCSVCHTASYQVSEDSNRCSSPPFNHTLDLWAFSASSSTARDPRFNADN